MEVRKCLLSVPVEWPAGCVPHREIRANVPHRNREHLASGAVRRVQSFIPYDVTDARMDLACIWRQLLLALPGAACCCCCCLREPGTCVLVFAGIILYIGTMQYIGTVLYLVGTVLYVSIAFYVVLFIAAVLAMRKHDLVPCPLC